MASPELPRELSGRRARKVEKERIARRARVICEHVGDESIAAAEKVVAFADAAQSVPVTATPLAAAHFALKAHVGAVKRKVVVRG